MFFAWSDPVATYLQLGKWIGAAEKSAIKTQNGLFGMTTMTPFGARAFLFFSMFGCGSRVMRQIADVSERTGHLLNDFNTHYRNVNTVIEELWICLFRRCFIDSTSLRSAYSSIIALVDLSNE